MLLKTWFLLLYLFSNIELEVIYFIRLVSNTKQAPDILNFKMETLSEFHNSMNI